MDCGRVLHVVVLVLICVASSLTDSDTCPSLQSSCGHVMKSIRHNEAENTVKLEHDTPIPETVEGDILIKVNGQHSRLYKKNNSYNLHDNVIKIDYYGVKLTEIKGLKQ